MYCYPDLMTPKSLCEKYSQVSLNGWNPAKIAIFLQTHLLIGVVKTRSTPCMIREKSFIRLMNYSRSLGKLKDELLDPKAKNHINLMTPMELFEAYPRVELNMWYSSNIGMFLNCKLLLGDQKGAGRSSIIAESSFLNLIDHSNSILEWRKVYARK